MANGFPNTKRARFDALRAVINPDTYADYRRICRWFSRNFHTPLVDVYDLSSDFVLQHYLEEQYEALTHEERRNMVIELTETPAERLERLRRESEEEAQSYADSQKTLDDVMGKIAKMKGSDIKAGLDSYREELAEKAAMKQQVQEEKKGPPTAADVMKALMSAKPLKTNSPEMVVPDTPPTPPKATPPPDLMPDFEMRFDDEDLKGFDIDLDSDGRVSKK